MSVDSRVVSADAARVMRVAVLMLAFGLACSASALAQVRTWTDSTGKFKMQAKFVELTDGKVKLEREDGSQFVIDLSKLSEADQKYANEQASTPSPFQAVPSKGKAKKSEDEEEEQPKPKKRVRPADEEEERPALKRRGRKTEAAEEEEEPKSAGDTEPKEVVPRWAGVTAVALAPAKDKWSFKFAPLEEASTIRKTRALLLPPKQDFFERLQSLVANPVIGWAAVGYTLDKDGKPQSRLAICDLRKGKFLGAAWTRKAGLMKPLAMRDNGIELIMGGAGFGRGSHDTLELWKMTSAGITRLVQWSPCDQSDRFNREVVWAAFIDADRLATMSGDGKLVVWSMEKVQPICILNTKNPGCIPTLSPDRKYIAFASEGSIGMFDVDAQEVTALQRAPARLSFPIFRFTPQGTRLICGSIGRIYVWDMATGGLYRDIWTDNMHLDENLVCPSEDQVLVGSKTLIDIDSQIRVWSYSGAERAAMLGDTCLFVASDDRSSFAIVPATIPQPGVREALRKALANPEFFVLQPGTTVRLNVNGIADPGEREKAAASLTEKLSANGFGVGPNGTIELAASTESTKQVEVSYHSFGHIGFRVYKVQEFVSRLRFLYQGKVAWEGTRNNVPGMLSLQGGESVEQALRRHEKPNYSYFQQAELPRLLTNPNSGSSTLGTSKVGSGGIL